MVTTKKWQFGNKIWLLYKNDNFITTKKGQPGAQSNFVKFILV